MIQNAALGRSQVFARSRVSVTCWRGDSKACVQAEMHKMGTKTIRHHPTTGLYSYGCINIFCWPKPMFVVDKKYWAFYSFSISFAHLQVANTPWNRLEQIIPPTSLLSVLPWQWLPGASLRTNFSSLQFAFQQKHIYLEGFQAVPLTGRHWYLTFL